MISRDEVSLRFAQVSSHPELERVFRELSKLTHPDLTGLDGDLFRYVSLVYDSTKQRIVKAGNEQSQSLAQPLEVLSELGYGPSTGARLACYALIARIFSSGILHRKVREQRGFQKRNEALIQALEYFVSNYDKTILPGLLSLLNSQVDALRPTAYLSANRDVRRFLDEGIIQFMRYQEESRPISKRLAKSSFDSCLDIISVYSLDLVGEKLLAQWFIAELEKPSLGAN